MGPFYDILAIDVDRLEEDLAARGKHIWVDREKIGPTANWSERVARGISDAKAPIC
jgi:hypothetical protein